MLIAMEIEKWKEVKIYIKEIDKIEFTDSLVVTKYRTILIYGFRS